jgi:hypothetical protein
MAIGQVVIQFEGICVNFSQLSFPFLPAAHRIVLINASDITEVWGNRIDRHYAAFSTDLDPTVPMFQLHGAVVQIVNPIRTDPQAGVTYDPTYQTIPSLTTLTPDLSPASLAVLIGRNPALTSCYFDIDYGTIGSATSQYGAFMTQVTILTDGDPLYMVTPFRSVLSSAPMELLKPLPATSSMYFWNEEDSPLGASNDDFMLSYLVLSVPPIKAPNLPTSPGGGPTSNRKATVLQAAAASANVHMTDFMTDVGCSNSRYP